MYPSNKIHFGTVGRYVFKLNISGETVARVVTVSIFFALYMKMHLLTIRLRQRRLHMDF